ncbi:Phosphorylase b kinase gamma catalytic chain, liver/testis isoform [Exaiptasia diaphana]|nr:Phosphorylase b kinase gamma catalytic chain, liver/testis isoform [Exaiptasia diaphana]
MFGAVIAIVAAKEFQHLMQSKLLPVSFDVLCNEPYGSKPIRKLIDGCAYRIYGHWVKRNKDANQNRAALFENKPNKEKYSSTDGKPKNGKRTLPFEASFRVMSFRSARKLPPSKGVQ